MFWPLTHATYDVVTARIRPPLNKRLFPVHRPTGLEKMQTRSFFNDFIKLFFFINILYIYKSRNI